MTSTPRSKCDFCQAQIVAARGEVTAVVSYLPCFHTLCQACKAARFRSSEPMPCQLCNRNFFAHQIFDLVVADADKIECRHCATEGTPSRAVEARCTTCMDDVLFCVACAERHRLFAGHVIHAVSNVILPRSQCSSHSNVFAVARCSCNMRVCATCEMAHLQSGHLLVPYQDLAQKATDAMRQLRVNLTKHDAIVARYAEECASRREKTRTLAAQARTNVASEIVEFCNELLRRGNDIVAAIDAAEANAQRTLTRIETDSKLAQQKLRKIECLMEMTLKTSDDATARVAAADFTTGAYAIIEEKERQILRNLEATQAMRIDYVSDLPALLNALSVHGQLNINGHNQQPMALTPQSARFFVVTSADASIINSPGVDAQSACTPTRVSLSAGTSTTSSMLPCLSMPYATSSSASMGAAVRANSLAAGQVNDGARPSALSGATAASRASFVHSSSATVTPTFGAPPQFGMPPTSAAAFMQATASIPSPQQFFQQQFAMQQQRAYRSSLPGGSGVGTSPMMQSQQQRQQQQQAAANRAANMQQQQAKAMVAQQQVQQALLLQQQQQQQQQQQHQFLQRQAVAMAAAAAAAGVVASGVSSASLPNSPPMMNNACAGGFNSGISAYSNPALAAHLQAAAVAAAGQRQQNKHNNSANSNVAALQQQHFQLQMQQLEQQRRQQQQQQQQQQQGRSQTLGQALGHVLRHDSTLGTESTIERINERPPSTASSVGDVPLKSHDNHAIKTNATAMEAGEQSNDAGTSAIASGTFAAVAKAKREREADAAMAASIPSRASSSQSPDSTANGVVTGGATDAGDASKRVARGVKRPASVPADEDGVEIRANSKSVGIPTVLPANDATLTTAAVLATKRANLDAVLFGSSTENNAEHEGGGEKSDGGTIATTRTVSLSAADVNPDNIPTNSPSVTTTNSEAANLAGGDELPPPARPSSASTTARELSRNAGSAAGTTIFADKISPTTINSVTRAPKLVLKKKPDDGTYAADVVDVKPDLNELDIFGVGEKTNDDVNNINEGGYLAELLNQFSTPFTSNDESDPQQQSLLISYPHRIHIGASSAASNSNSKKTKTTKSTGSAGGTSKRKKHAGNNAAAAAVTTLTTSVDEDVPVNSTDSTVKDHWDDYCFVCNQGCDDSTGVLGCCDACPRVYHNRCHAPAIRSEMGDLPENWRCTICISCEIPREPLANFGKRAILLCSKVLMSCCKIKPDSETFYFPVPRNIGHYYTMITRPICMRDIARKLGVIVAGTCAVDGRVEGVEYTAVEQFLDDMNLLFQNCSTFNKPNTDIEKSGRQIYTLYCNAVRAYLPPYEKRIWIYNSLYVEEMHQRARRNAAQAKQKRRETSLGK